MGKILGLQFNDWAAFKKNMKRIDFEKFLSILSSDLYSFAFILIPDDLQAGQLVVDAMQAYLITNKKNLEDFFQTKSSDLNVFFAPIKKEVLKLIYELAKKRFHQIRLSIEDISKKEGFYHLELEEKAAIFLKDKMKLNNDEISLLTMRSKSEVLSALYSARIKMIDVIPFKIHQEVNV